MTPEFDGQQVGSILVFGVPLFLAAYFGGLGPAAAIAIGGFGGVACSMVYLTIRMKRGTYIPAARLKQGQKRPELLPPDVRRRAAVVALATVIAGIVTGALIGYVERGAALGIILAPAVAQATVYGKVPRGKSRPPSEHRGTAGSRD